MNLLDFVNNPAISGNQKRILRMRNYAKLCRVHFFENADEIAELIESSEIKDDRIFIPFDKVKDTPFFNIPIFPWIEGFNPDDHSLEKNIAAMSIDYYFNALRIENKSVGSKFIKTSNEEESMENGIFMNLNSNIKLYLQ